MIEVPNDYGKVNVAISRFWTEHVPVNGGASVQEVDFCEVVKRGSTLTVSNKIDQWKRGEKTIWQTIEPEYLRWKKGETETPADGTPLAAWPAITSKGMIDHLRNLKILTVEHLADMTSSDAERIGMGARRLIDLARAFVETKKGSAAISAALAERDEKIRVQQVEIDDLKDKVEKLLAAMPQKAPRPRGTAAPAGELLTTTSSP